MEKTTELVVISAEDFGIKESKAQEIQAVFQPMMDKMVELEKQYNVLIDKPIDLEVMAEARELRLLYRDSRTETASLHKELKAFYLNGGRFVDSWKKTHATMSEGNEEKLKLIENHFKIQEELRVSTLQNERAEKLAKYELTVIPSDLGNYTKEVWDAFLIGCKTNFELKKQAEKDAKEKQKVKDLEEKLYRKRKLEFFPLFQYMDSKERLSNFGKLTEAKFKKRILELKKLRDIEIEKARKDKAEKEALKVKNDELSERLRKSEEAENERLLAEQEAEKVIEIEVKDVEIQTTGDQAIKEISVSSELNDIKQLALLIMKIESIKTSFSFRHKGYQTRYKNISTLLDKVIVYAKKEIE